MRTRTRSFSLFVIVLILAMLLGSQTFAEGAAADGFTAVSSNMKGAVKVKKGVIYQQPSTKSAVVTTLSFATKVATVREKGNWYYVSYSKNNKTYEGYMTGSQVVKYDKHKKHIALTFDDGPKAGSTNIVLNALQKNGCRATFFLVGRSINRKTRKLVKREKALGCEIGNHSYSHPKLGGSGAKGQLAKTDKIIKSVIGTKPTLCRAPYGSINNAVLRLMKRPHILWSVDTLDWKHRNTSKLIATVKRQKRDGAIILMHDLHMPTARGVDAICRDLKNSGYEAVTVTELAAINGKTLKAGKSYRRLYK